MSLLSDQRRVTFLIVPSMRTLPLLVPLEFRYSTGVFTLGNCNGSIGDAEIYGDIPATLGEGLAWDLQSSRVSLRSEGEMGEAAYRIVAIDPRNDETARVRMLRVG